MNNKKRIEWIDYLKAFACFLVVLGHLIQSLQKANIDKYQYITEYINWFIYLFHMPLFMCMSGVLYFRKNLKFNNIREYFKFVKDKFINLSIPYFTFYLLYVFINMLFANSVNSKKGIEDIMGIFNNPIPPYWFLYALLSIFIFIPILEKILKNNRKVILIVLAALKIINIFIHTPVYFVNQIMSYGFYFYIGAFILCDEKERSKENIIKNGISILLYVILSLIVYIRKNNLDMFFTELLRIGFSVWGIYICVNIFKMVKKSIVLNTYKKYTFQIFILHTIFAAGIRIVLLKFNITNYLIHFFMGIIFSIYIPVLVSIISEKILFTNFFFFPLKTVKELKNKKYIINKNI